LNTTAWIALLIHNIMPAFTDVEEGEYQDFLSEVVHFSSPNYRKVIRRVIWTQRQLYNGDHIFEWVPTFELALGGTWIMQVVSNILDNGGEQWLIEQANNESFEHELKTDDRMLEVSSLSGLARILFTSVVKLRWVHPTLKAYLYALAWVECEREYPHRSEVTIATGHYVSVFPF